MPELTTKQKLKQANVDLMGAWSLILDASTDEGVSREIFLELSELTKRIDKIQNHLTDIEYSLGAHPVRRNYGRVTACKCSGDVESEAR